MEFEWDEAKRTANVAKHRLDFIDAVALFDRVHAVENAKTVAGEARFLATGVMDEAIVTAVFTLRGETVRLISLRRARRGEKRRYKALFV